MLKYLAFIACILGLALAGLDTLVPQPQIVNIHGEQTLNISNINFQFYLNNEKVKTIPAHQIKQEFMMLDYLNKQEEAKQFSKYTQIKSDSSFVSSHYKMVERYMKERFSAKKSNSNGQELQVHILLNEEGMEKINDVMKIKENYKINIKQSEISNEFEAVFDCEGHVSFLRALETFFQLFESKANTLKSLPLSIEDEPTYKWRGLMLDTARQYLLMERIIAQIEGMRTTKLNVLHIHFTDSDSFPVVIEEVPQLSDYGAYSSEQVYTLADIKFLVQYGQENGVMVVPEFDAPAHTRSWAQAPEFADVNACAGYPPAQWSKYCAQPPCGALNPATDLTWEIVQKIVDYQKSAFTTDYLHMGGDEVNFNCWEFNPSIKQWMDQQGISDYEQLEIHFRNRQAEMVGNQKTRIYWADSSDLLNFPDESDIIQFWDTEDTYHILDQFKNPIILSTLDFLYFDCGTGSMLGDNSWCDPYKTWKKVYSFKPSNSKFGDRLYGAEACLWAEVINNANVDNKAWPRATSLALRLWNESEELPITELMAKLVEVNNILTDIYGMNPNPITTEYCQKNINMCFFD